VGTTTQGSNSSVSYLSPGTRIEWCIVVMNFLARSRKALTAAVFAFSTGFGAANADSVITKEEWAYIIGLTIIGTASVWTIKNRPEETNSRVRSVKSDYEKY